MASDTWDNVTLRERGDQEREPGNISPYDDLGE